MFYIFNICLSLILIIVCVERVFANSYEYKRVLNVNSTTAEMPSLFPSFDVQMSQIRFLKISNDNFSMPNAGDPVTFMLIGNELYRLTENSLDAIAVFTDTTDQPKSEQTYFNINDIQVIIIFALRYALLAPNRFVDQLLINFRLAITMVN